MEVKTGTRIPTPFKVHDPKLCSPANSDLLNRKSPSTIAFHKARLKLSFRLRKIATRWRKKYLANQQRFWQSEIFLSSVLSFSADYDSNNTGGRFVGRSGKQAGDMLSTQVG